MLGRRPKPAAPVEWLLVGLGNPGGEYRGTRHNVGWEVIDALAARARIKLDRGRHRARVGAGELEGVPVLLVKPLTYMNLSGQAVAPLMREANLEPSRVLVIADDLALPVGKLRLKLRGGAGGHNGHRSIAASLRTDEYPRLKVGIGEGDEATVDHVLGAFTRAEREVIDEKVEAAARIAVAFLLEGENAALRLLELENA